MALVCGGLLFVCLAQPLIQLEGLLVHQRHLGHVWVQVLPQGRQPVVSPALLNRWQKD